MYVDHNMSMIRKSIKPIGFIEYSFVYNGLSLFSCLFLNKRASSFIRGFICSVDGLISVFMRTMIYMIDFD